MDYRTHQRRLLPALATTYALHFAQERLVARAARGVHRARTTTARGASSKSRLAGGEGVATWHASPHDPGVPRGVRWRGLPRRTTASPR